MKATVALATVLLFLSPLVVSAASKDPPASRDYLETVTKNGRALFDYDQAAWQATDAFLALKPDRNAGGKYIARKTDAGWTVAFGDLSPAGDSYLVTYEAIETSAPGIFEVKKYDPPRQDSGYYLCAAKALYLAVQQFGNDHGRPYNTAVLPAPNSGLYVYLYPAQTKNNIYPLGGDTRYTISADGTTVLEKRQLHKAIIEVDMSSIPKGAQSVGGYHSHVLSDTPEDTDVLLVLTRQPHLPEYIRTEAGTYVVQTDGTIALEKK